MLMDVKTYQDWSLRYAIPQAFLSFFYLPNSATQGVSEVTLGVDIDKNMQSGSIPSPSGGWANRS